MSEASTDPYLKIDGPHRDGIPPEELQVNIGGPHGKSIFHRAVAWSIRADGLKTIQTALNDQFVHVRDANDDRLLALVSALVVENAVDRLLAAVMPGYTALRDRMEFTFSMRIEIAKALRLIPSRILGCADLIRGIRNDFAHDLSTSSFDELKPSKLQSMRDRLSAYGPGLAASDDHAEIFQQLVMWTAIALHVYTLQVAALGEFLRTEEFMTCLEGFASKEG